MPFFHVFVIVVVPCGQKTDRSLLHASQKDSCMVEAATAFEIDTIFVFEIDPIFVFQNDPPPVDGHPEVEKNLETPCLIEQQDHAGEVLRVFHVLGSGGCLEQRFHSKSWCAVCCWTLLRKHASECMYGHHAV